MDAIAEQLIEAALASLKGPDETSASKGHADAPAHQAVDAERLFRGTEAQVRHAASLLNARIRESGLHFEIASVPPLAGHVGHLEVRLVRDAARDCQLDIAVDGTGHADCRMTVQDDSRKMRAFNVLDVDQGHFEQLLATFFSKAVSEAGRML